MPEVGYTVKAREIGYSGSGRYVWTACSDCGKERWNRYVKNGTNLNYCHSCWQKKSRNSSWKGGIIKNIDGYLIYRIPENHEFYCMRNSNDVVLMHRLLMAMHLQRPLKNEEIVHHINEDITDNRIDNLKLFRGKGEHTRLHHLGKKMRKKHIY